MPKPSKSKPQRKNKAANQSSVPQYRLQKFLAQAGVGSRRECEELISEGRVTVGGQVVKKLGSQVDADAENVRVDGSKVIPSRMQYFMVHKPTGVLSTCRDPEGRLRVIDLIKTDQRVYNVGRLDKSSEGLILVTNDGDLANRLTHPRYGIKKTYHVTVAGNPKWSDLQQLKRGIRLAEAVAQVSEVKIRKRRRDSCDLIMVLEEGRNREIRRLLAHIGHKVTRLKRVAIGSLQLGSLKPGDYRRLELKEVEALQKASSRVQPRKMRKTRPVETSQLEGEKNRKKNPTGKGRGSGPAKKTASGKKRAVGTASGKRVGQGSTKKRVASKRPTSKKQTSSNSRSTAKKRQPTKKKSTAVGKKRTTSSASRRGAGRLKKGPAKPRTKGGGTRGTGAKKVRRSKKRTVR